MQKENGRGGGGGGKCGCEQRISYCEHEKKSVVQLGSVRVDMNRELVIVKIKKESREVKSGEGRVYVNYELKLFRKFQKKLGWGPAGGLGGLTGGYQGGYEPRICYCEDEKSPGRGGWRGGCEQRIKIIVKMQKKCWGWSGEGLVVGEGGC